MAARTTTLADGADVTWVEAPDGYQLGLRRDRIVARSAKGKVLASVPKALKECAPFESLGALRDWLGRHEAECRASVERWMLGSLPVATAALVAVWEDPAWRSALTDAVVTSAGGKGGVAGFLRGADPARGIGIVDLDGETGWLTSKAVTIPHPVLLDDLDDLRSFGAELGAEQGVLQLLREVHRRPAGDAPEGSRLADFAGGESKELRHLLQRCRSLGFAVRGGYATCRVFEAGAGVQARYWVGADDPGQMAWTGDLFWVDSAEHALALADVGPVAWSEGVRMASLVHAGRVVEGAP